MIKMKHLSFSLAALTGFACLCSSGSLLAQQPNVKNVELTDLSAFKNPGSSWQIVGGVAADINKENFLYTSKGAGILVNFPTKNQHGADLFSVAEHGDIDLELDYMMASGSNSGIYLQGTYELQLEDSWATKNANYANNGGIYERWNDSKPEGQKGYEGHSPRQNASKAPGLWQHLKISFQAPRFNNSGVKIANARFLKVELNGVLIQENVDLSGPTRGSMSANEQASGPLRLQGDHGAVAFRNIKFLAKPIVKVIDDSDSETNITNKVKNADEVNTNNYQVDPVLVDAPVNTVLRSFMDLPNHVRVVHAVSVGSAERVHYTYDLDKGALVQVWRGGFLDATPMWHERGDGSARPRGAVQQFGKPLLNLAKLSSAQAAWVNDTTGTGFKINGYELDDQDRPVFMYTIYGKQIKDATVVIENGKGISRTISVENPSADLYVRLADAASIEELNGMYLIDDKSYYIKLENAGDKPVIRDLNGRKELIMPLRSSLSYSILF
jgi:hypothetical protein